MIQTILANKAMILGVLFGISEALAQIPGIASNSVFQLISKALKFAKDKLVGAPQAPAA